MKKVLKVQYVFYFFLVVALGFMIFTIFSFHVDDRTISNSQVIHLDDWKVTFSDGSYRKISLPNEITVDPNDKIILTNMLDAEFYGMTLAFHSVNQSVAVRLDGKKLYEFGLRDERPFEKSPGNLWHYITLPDSFETGRLEIELTSPFRNLGGRVNEVLYGARSACILYFMQEEWIGLFSGFTLLLFGFLFMVYHFAMGHLKLRNTGMFHLGVSSVMLACNLIILTGMVQIFYGNSSVYYFASYTLLYLCIVPFLLYLADTIYEMRKKQLLICAWIGMANFIVAFLLQVCNLVDYYQYRKIFLALIILLLAYMIYLDLQIFYKKENHQMHVWMLVLLAMESLMLVLDFMISWRDSIPLSQYGLLLMMLILGTMNISEVVKDYRVDLDTRMQENDEKSNKLALEHDQLLEQIEYLRSSKEYADQYSASKSLFLSSVSKKLIVPISNIIGMAELIMRDEINENVKEKLVSMQTAGTTALTLTNNIIDYTQYETNSLELKCVSYPVEKMLYDMNESVAVGLIEKNVDFLVDFSPNIPRELFGDEIRIRQILTTILSNAVRYTQEGTIRFQVNANISTADEVNLNITISDTGVGIKEENLESLFDMFLLYKTDDAVAGTGLGLAVCKKLIDLMHGSISVKSRFGDGTTFYLEIPQKIINGMPLVEVDRRDCKTLVYESDLPQKMLLKKVFMDLNLDAEFVADDEEFISKLDSGIYHTVLICERQYKKHQAYLQQPLNAPIRKVVMADIANTIQAYENADILQRPIQCMNLYDAISGNDIVEPIAAESTSHFVAPQANILIVDDSPANLKIVTGMMERYRMNIQTAISGTACLEMLMASMEYDMVFLDYSMPGVSGVETLRTLREYNDKYYKTLPVIAMTISMINGAKELFVEEGFDDYIPKPLEQNQLNTILEKFLPKEKIIRNDIIHKEDSEEEADFTIQEIAEEKAVESVPEEGMTIEETGGRE